MTSSAPAGTGEIAPDPHSAGPHAAAPGSTRAVGLPADPNLPYRDEMLDVEAVAAILRGVLAGRPDPVQVAPPTLVKYRWAESLRAVYPVRIGGRSRIVAARMFASTALAVDAWRAAIDDAPSAALDRTRNTVWFTYPDDRRLRGLADLDRPPAGVADLPAGRWVSSALVQYAPERSATFRALDAAGNTVGFAKLYRHPTEAADLARCYADVAARVGRSVEGFATPRPLACDAHRGLLVLEPMAGVAWTEVPPERQQAALAVVGAGLRRLHGIGGIERRPFTRLHPDKLTSAATLIAQARPDVATETLRLGARLTATAPGAETDRSATVLVHGDLHPKNVLVAADGVGLIDLDQAALGSPANDLGSLLARLRHGTLLGETDDDGERRLSTAFVDGYGHPVADLSWHVAAALLAERALRALTRIHPGGLVALAATIDAAHAYLDAGDR